MTIKQGSLIGLSIILCGCALFGPEYKKPEVETPKNWQEVATNTVVTKSEIDIAKDPWWKKFNDKNLDNLIEEALENNNDIQTAIGNITVAAGNLQQIKMAWVPTVSAGAIYGVGQSFNTSNSTSIQLPLPPGTIPNSNSSNFNFFSYGLIPSYSINIIEQLKKQDVAKTNLELAKANKDAIRLAIISQVSGSYFTAIALNNEITAQKKLIAHLTEMVNMVKIQYKNGLATQNDVNSTQQKLSQAKMQLPDMEHNLVMANNSLQVLVNKNLGKTSDAKDFIAVNTNSMIPINLPSSVLNSRPDVKIAEYQLKIANDNIGVATSNFFPKLNLTTPIGGYNSQIGDLFSANGNFWNAQIAATMPILNLGLHALIKQSKGQYYISYYNYIKTVKTAFADVNNSLSGYEQIQTAYSEANKFYNSSNSSAQLNTLSYKSGYISYLDSLSSQISLDNAKILLNQTKLQQLQAIVSLYQSLAAGYNYKNTETPKSFGDRHDA